MLLLDSADRHPATGQAEARAPYGKPQRGRLAPLVEDERAGARASQCNREDVAEIRGPRGVSRRDFRADYLTASVTHG